MRLTENLIPDEELLIGSWTEVDGKVLEDDVCRRIRFLTKERLQKKGTDGSGWETLFQDPVDYRYWELTYPEGHLHGGGPPMLRVLSEKEAKLKFPHLV